MISNMIPYPITVTYLATLTTGYNETHYRKWWAMIDVIHSQIRVTGHGDTEAEAIADCQEAFKLEIHFGDYNMMAPHMTSYFQMHGVIDDKLNVVHRFSVDDGE